MKIDFYEEFVKLAETESFSRAAEELPFTQAALTQHIQKMESILGVKLFERSTRSVELSEYGKLIFPHARHICKLKADALSAVSQQLMHKHFDLSIGFYPAAGRYSFVDKIQLFQANHPDISVKYRELLPEVLTDSMARGEFDFVILEERDSVIDKDYERLCLNSDTLAAVLPANHPLAGYNAALLTQLSKEQFHMLPERTFVNRLAADACHEAGFTPNVTYTSYSIRNILEMISKSSAVSLLMKAPAEKYQVPGVVIVDLLPRVTSSVNLLYRKNSLSTFGQTFLDFMASQPGP